MGRRCSSAHGQNCVESCDPPIVLHVPDANSVSSLRIVDFVPLRGTRRLLGLPLISVDPSLCRVSLPRQLVLSDRWTLIPIWLSSLEFSTWIPFLHFAYIRHRSIRCSTASFYLDARTCYRSSRHFHRSFSLRRSGLHPVSHLAWIWHYTGEAFCSRDGANSVLRSWFLFRSVKKIRDSSTCVFPTIWLLRNFVPSPPSLFRCLLGCISPLSSLWPARVDVDTRRGCGGVSIGFVYGPPPPLSTILTNRQADRPPPLDASIIYAVVAFHNPYCTVLIDVDVFMIQMNKDDCAILKQSSDVVIFLFPQVTFQVRIISSGCYYITQSLLDYSTFTFDYICILHLYFTFVFTADCRIEISSI